MYVLSKNKKISHNFHLKIIVFAAGKNCRILHGHVCVMQSALSDYHCQVLRVTAENILFETDLSGPPIFFGMFSLLLKRPFYVCLLYFFSSDISKDNILSNHSILHKEFDLTDAFGENALQTIDEDKELNLYDDVEEEQTENAGNTLVATDYSILILASQLFKKISLSKMCLLRAM